MLRGLILGFHVLLALMIIGLVLLQRGKGAEAGAGFGSGASGTEPVIRVMVEGYDAGLVKKGARAIAAAVEAAAGGPVEATDAPVDEADSQTWAGLAVTGRRK